jgi:hypothetical protein
MLLMLAAAALNGACGSGGDDDIVDLDPADLLDANVPPVTAGNWYRPSVNVTWQWQLDGTINTSYSVDLYDMDLFETPDAVFATLHARGARVLCYFSAGSGENGRPDYGQIPAEALGKALDGYPDERWLDIRRRAVLDVMIARLDLAVRRGCDGVEPDNVTAYNNDTGFPISETHQLAFNRHLANAAHERRLAIALKNDGDQVAQLVDYFDLELNEECHDYDECDVLRPFLDKGKPVLNAEYSANLGAAQARSATLCPQARASGLRTLILHKDLDDTFRVSCF